MYVLLVNPIQWRNDDVIHKTPFNSIILRCPFKLLRNRMHKTTGTPKALSLHSEYIKNCDFKLAHKVNTVQLLLWSARRKTNYQLMDPIKHSHTVWASQISKGINRPKCGPGRFMESLLGRVNVWQSPGNLKINDCVYVILTGKILNS